MGQLGVEKKYLIVYGVAPLTHYVPKCLLAMGVITFKDASSGPTTFEDFSSWSITFEDVYPGSFSLLRMFL